MPVYAYKNKPFDLEINIPSGVLGSGESVYVDIYRPDGTLVTSSPIEMTNVPNTTIYRASVTLSDTGKYDAEIWRGTFDSSTGKRSKSETLKYVEIIVKEVDPDDLAKMVEDIRKKLSIYVL